MPNLNSKYDTLLFGKTTTYTDSYRPQKASSLVSIKYGFTREKQRKPRPDFVPIKDLHAMTPWKDPNIPFDAFHRPDPIIRRDPRNMQERFDKPQNEDRPRVQKSRPKVVMKPPAKDLDAFQEPDRKIVVDNMYLTTTMIAQREAMVAAVNFKNVRAPLTNSYSKCRPVSIEPLEMPYVSPEWRMDTVTWDDKQLRARVYPTRHFWLHREKP